MPEIGEDALSHELTESIGPWPFTTRRTYVLPDLSRAVWRSRDHRKALPTTEPGGLDTVSAKLLRCLWMPRQLNWWIGVVFALGALLFMLGSGLSLAPAIAQKWSLQENTINAIFFAGSIPFTVAAYLQLFQSANAKEFLPHGSPAPRRVAPFGWHPNNIGWLSSALQFLGTLLFNVNTFDAMVPGLDWLQQDLAIWVPDVVGSVFFLASGYLAFAETCHAYFAWKPARISWWVTFVNLFGCVAFMISAVFAFIPPESPRFDALTISVIFTFVGAIGFLIGSLLMLPETATPAES